MAIEEDIVAAIAASAPLVALVGARVYADEAPQDAAYPLIVFTTIAAVPVTSLDGASAQDNYRIQFDAWAETFDAARAVCAALVTALEGAAALRQVRLAGPYSGPVEPDLKLFRRIVEFSFWQ